MTEEKARIDVEQALGREVKVLQEMLNSMEEEQQALLQDNPGRLKEIVTGREELMESLAEARDDRILKVSQLKSLIDNVGLETISESDSLEFLKDYSNIEHINVHELYKKIASLIEAMEVYNERNQYLLKNKVNFTKELIYRLHPKESGTIYGPPGYGKQKKKKVSTITIINHEG